MSDNLEGKRILHLTLKKKWFDMIASGEKKEEYRDVKPYWISRLVDGMGHPHSCADFNFKHKNGYEYSMDYAVGYDYVEFRNGYRKDSPRVLVKILDIVLDAATTSKWGAEYGKQYFIIKLGDIIKP